MGAHYREFDRAGAFIMGRIGHHGQTEPARGGPTAWEGRYNPDEVSVPN